MVNSLPSIVCHCVTFAVLLGNLVIPPLPADDVEQIQKSVAKLDPEVLSREQQELQRAMLDRYLRAGIQKANAASTEAWNKIQSRDEWERFRREKLEQLAKSLSRQPFVPGKPKIITTGIVRGEGFRIENLVILPDGRTAITANLYVPEQPRDSMPGIILSHSHHNPKHESELQDMGMTWARAGCYVIVPDHLGHGERRQHPFHSAADYRAPFAVGRQDYYFRYDMSLQLYLVGESLVGWLVHDLMSCVDVLVTQPEIDATRILLLGAVAGGGDPAAVTAALDDRIACVVPFNFGGPQPENRYPLPEDAETSFNYAGSGSWESTRNLARSAADGFLPWVIVGGVAPRHVIHAHEFSWDSERDPVWKRYQKIWGFYDAQDRLAFAHGHGTLTGKDPPGSHCNNIGTVHRGQIHDAFRKWFGIEVKPEDEYHRPRNRDELNCLTDDVRQRLAVKPLHEVLGAMADEQVAAGRIARSKTAGSDRRSQICQSWVRLLGNVTPPGDPRVHDGFPRLQQLDGVTVLREVLETEPGILVPVMTMMHRKAMESGHEKRAGLLFGVASDGIAKILQQRREMMASALNAGHVVVLVEVRGTGASNISPDHGAQSAATSRSATQLMLGEPILAGQLRDVRAAWRYVRPRYRDATTRIVGGSAHTPLDKNEMFSHPRRIEPRPHECEPTGALLALLLALFECDQDVTIAGRGLVTFRSALDTPFVQIPHDCIVPGLLCEGDLPDLTAALAPHDVRLESTVDALGRLVPLDDAKKQYQVALEHFQKMDALDRFRLTDSEADHFPSR